MADPLKTLLRLRRLEVDAARMALAERMREERAVHAALSAAQDARERETRLAGAASLQDRGLDGFVAWLGVQRAECAALGLRRTAAADSVEAARAGLGESRSAAEAVEELLSQQRRRTIADRARLEQLALDETAGRGNGLG